MGLILSALDPLVNIRCYGPLPGSSYRQLGPRARLQRQGNPPREDPTSAEGHRKAPPRAKCATRRPAGTGSPRRGPAPAPRGAQGRTESTVTATRLGAGIDEDQA